MLNVIKRELRIEETLKKKIEIICGFCNTKPTFINGSIRKIDKTNLSYIEPHRVIIKNKLFLVFNYSDDVYIENLSKKMKLKDFEDIENLKTTYSKHYITEIAEKQIEKKDKQNIIRKKSGMNLEIDDISE